MSKVRTNVKLLMKNSSFSNEFMHRLVPLPTMPQYGLTVCSTSGLKYCAYVNIIVGLSARDHVRPALKELHYCQSLIGSSTKWRS